MKRCFLVVWIAMIGSAAMLNAAVEKPLEKISPLGGWKQTAPGRFEIRHEGTHVAHLMAEATVEPKSYYRISWKAEAGKDWKTLEPNAMIQVGKSEYIAWNPSEKSAPRSVCFYSGDGGKLKCSLYLPRKSTGTLAVEQLKLEKLEEKDLHDNLIRNGDFEAENTLPGEWRKSWKQKKTVESIVPEHSFLAGKQSLSLLQEEKSVIAAVNSLPIPILPGKTYTLSFWAKGQENQKFRAAVDLPNQGKPQGHFRKAFLLGNEWKHFSFSVTFPSDETRFPALRNRMARISFSNESGTPGATLIDQVEFRIAK